MRYFKINQIFCMFFMFSSIFSLKCSSDEANLFNGTDSGDADSGGDGDSDADTDTDTDTSKDGCDGVDFLFVIDNSGSMKEEQTNLINSFPGFINTIIETLDLNNFHIMVVDSDAGGGGSPIMCIFGGDTCCVDKCQGEDLGKSCMQGFSDSKECWEWLEQPEPTITNCEITIGAGRITEGATGDECSNIGPERYIKSGLTDTELNDTFSCIAHVGTEGSGDELIIPAMMDAVGKLDAPGLCNDGFLRKNAILVVTFITDEISEDEQSTADWKQALVDAKNGNEEGIVLLGIHGGITGCATADAAPKLDEFVGLFGDRGHFCSVCLTDYSECFTNAVSIIDLTCEKFVPIE